MVTSAVLYHFMNFFHLTIDIRNVCVFLAPLFSSFTTLVTYHLTKELKVGGSAGLLLCTYQRIVIIKLRYNKINVFPRPLISSFTRARNLCDLTPKKSVLTTYM